MAVIRPAGDAPAWCGGNVNLDHLFIVDGIGVTGNGTAFGRVTLYMDVVCGIGLKDGLVVTRRVAVHIEAAYQGRLIVIIIPVNQVEALIGSY